MKNVYAISYVTIMLILFQSFSAAANTLDFHAIDKEHLQQEHQHSIDDKVVNLSSDNTTNQHNPADCHHCGHCQGTHAQWLGQSSLQGVNIAQQFHQFYYLKGIIEAPANRLLRPPKV